MILTDPPLANNGILRSSSPSLHPLGTLMSFSNFYDNYFSKEIEEKSIWDDSRFLKAKNLNNQAKGKFGVDLIMYIIKSRGGQARYENKNSIDVVSNLGETVKNIEVKTGCASYTKKGSWAKSWFNQIRFEDKDWDSVWLVEICVDRINVYSKDREFMSPKDFGIGHKGTEQLKDVKLSPKGTLANSKEYWNLEATFF